MSGLLCILRRVNLRHLWQRKVRTLLTASGIAAGVALVFSISIINDTLLSSFRASVRDLAGDAELEVASPDQNGLPESAIDEVAAAEGVERLAPVVRSTSRLVGPDGEERVLIIGATPTFATLFPTSFGPFADLDLSGSFGPDLSGLVLSQRVLEETGARVGESVVVETPQGSKLLQVSGRMRGGLIGALNGGNLGVMVLPAAQATFEKEGRIDSIYVVASGDRSLDDVQAAIEQRLGGAAVVGPPGVRGEGLERVFGGLGTLISLAGTVALFVALFVVYNTMSISLAERRREISMALALGAARRHIFGGFLTEALFLGAVASAAGIVGGLLLARVLVESAVEGYRILPITGTGPIVVTGRQVALGVSGGLVVSVLGAFVPARRVLSVAPIEALRPEAAYEWDRGPSLFGRRRGVAGGIVLIAASLVLQAVYVLFAPERWLATTAVVVGLSGVTLLLPWVVPIAVRIVRPLLIRPFGTSGRLAADALEKNPGRTTFTVAALVLTMGMVIAVGSALASYQAQVQRTASALLGAPIYVVSRSFTGLTSDQPLPASLGPELSAVEGVRYVYPLRFQFLSLGGQQALVYAIPVERALQEGATSVLASITDDPDEFVSSLERGEVTISRLTAERRDAEVGDELSLPTPEGRRRFRIGAIFDDLVSFESIYVGYETYRDAWNDDKADEFGVLVEEGTSVQIMKQRLQDVVEREEVAARVLEKQDLVGRILEIVEGTFSLGRGIQFAALIVALLSIANTMFTAVLERRWEMALQRAVGMGKRRLAQSVLLEAAGIGAIGGVGGAIVGAASGYLMTQAMEAQFSWRIAFQPPLLLIGVAVLGGALVSILAGALPSRMAARVPIVESLRYE